MKKKIEAKIPARALNWPAAERRKIQRIMKDFIRNILQNPNGNAFYRSVLREAGLSFYEGYKVEPGFRLYSKLNHQAGRKKAAKTIEAKKNGQTAKVISMSDFRRAIRKTA